MAHLHRRAVVAAVSIFMLCGGGSLVAASAVSASTDFPLQPQCGPDPLTLIDPCEVPPGPNGVPAPEIPWDLVDEVLFA
ncbi:hypothetical protein [Mycolicibacterium sp. CR10]|uniref:hypothetical protein n=1 Tax=Mycolicibacterium sp. CR10 TaxID=2562314 RepID=UPI0010BF84CD|nr:hypothetical protein [Mycolicibacterium sp. CR10]